MQPYIQAVVGSGTVSLEENDLIDDPLQRDWKYRNEVERVAVLSKVYMTILSGQISPL